VRSSQKPHQQHFFKNWVLEHWDLVDRLAQRRFVSESLSEEAGLYVMNRLAQDDWHLLRGHRGSARLKTYFSAVVYNLLEDFARKKFGRVRPPSWIRKLGGIWLLLYRFMCLERYEYAEATSLAADRYGHLRQNQIEQMADRILAEIPGCGKVQFSEVSLNEEHHGGVSAQPSTQEIAEKKERELLMKGLHDLFFGPDPDLSQAEPLLQLLDCPVDLKADERLLLTLCHVEGVSVSEAGKKLGLNRFQAHGKLRRLYGRLRRTFDSAGCGEELRLLLAERTDTKR
jgi:RNA polymerase sigma factor (sigma-70 family)